MAFEVLKILLVLIIILAGLYMFLRLIKQRVMPQKGFIDLIYFYPLGTKRGIGIVKVLDEYFVLGIGDQNVSLIDKLNPKVAEASLNVMTENNVQSFSIKDLFKNKGKLIFSSFWFLCGLLFSETAFCAPAPPAVGGGILGLNSPLEILLFFTLLSILPAMLVMCTCFTRIIVVLSFLKQAMGTPQAPPNTVLIGLALFITFFIMSPVFDRVYSEAYLPYTKKQIDAETALNKASVPLKEFMLRQTKEKDLALFLKISKSERPASPMDLPMKVVVPAFAIGELQKAFEIGFLIYLPFLVIDMVVGSILLAMGMMMLPPVMVSLPVKLLLFVLADGWELIIGSLIGSFR